MSTARLTAKLVEALKPPASGRLEVWDQAVPGLGIRLAADGSRTWCIRYRVSGRRRRLKLGPFPASGLSDARGLAREVLGQVAKGADPAAERSKARSAGTVEGLVDEFLTARRPRLRANTLKEYGRVLRVYALPVVGRKGPREVTRTDVRAILRRVATLLSREDPVQANRVKAVVSAMFSWAADQDIVSSNPAYRLSDPVPEKSRDRVYAPYEIRALWAALDDDPASEAIRLLLLTAQRRGEVSGMPWSEVDWGERVWRYPAERTKAKRSHVVPLSPQAVSVLQRVRALGLSDRWVFPASRGGGPSAAPTPAGRLPATKLASPTRGSTTCVPQQPRGWRN